MNPSFSSQSPWLSLVRARGLGNNWQSATASFLGVWVIGEEVWAGVGRSCHWAMGYTDSIGLKPNKPAKRHGKEEPDSKGSNTNTRVARAENGQKPSIGDQIIFSFTLFFLKQNPCRKREWHQYSGKFANETM